MKMSSMAAMLAAMGVAVAYPTDSTAGEAFARSSDRQPQQVAALMRGFAVGHGWILTQETSANDHAVIAMRLCLQPEDGERAELCGQFAVLGNGDKSEIILLHAERSPATQVGHDLPSEAMEAFSDLLDAVSAPATHQVESRLRCDATGCP